MTPIRVTPNALSWEIAGRNAAEAINGFDAIAVISEDSAAACDVARGIAEVRGVAQPVILADLMGNLPALGSLITDDDPHGIAESFEYGISLGRIAHPTRKSYLRVIPSGDGDVQRAEILGSARWARLAASCRKSETLLLVLARSTAPGLSELVSSLDGAVIVGPAPVESVPPSLVLHRVTRPVSKSSPPPVSAPAAAVEKPAPVHAQTRSSHRRRVLITGIAALLLIAALAAGYVAWRSYASPVRSDRPSAPAERFAPVLALPAPVPEPQAANAADSANAAAYAVEILSANTRDGANFELGRNRDRLAAATIAPTVVGTERAVWYKVIGGAYRTRDQADSLLVAARRRGMISDSAGLLVRVPFAWLVDSVPSRGAARQTVRKYVTRGLPAYALVQADGRALVYVGAFERGSESSALAEELRAAGLSPVLVYRTGRPL